MVFVERERESSASTPRKASANPDLKGASTPPVQSGDLPESYTETWYDLGDEKERHTDTEQGEEKEIEEIIIRELLGRHTKWIEHV